MLCLPLFLYGRAFFLSSLWASPFFIYTVTPFQQPSISDLRLLSREPPPPTPCICVLAVLSLQPLALVRGIVFRQLVCRI
eukprot:SM000075S22002  [mRNA]  locus=s75:601938:603878:- [translate_table: standard]